ncbi:hypothetical protein OG21DRAFT_1607520 [Imleria badia]|nr:hypothetical protein OG21DRAFT_1607520 [Imleria badia]
MDIHAESLANLLASVRQHTQGSPIPALPMLNRGDAIEIQGPASSGKTHLLYHILLSFLVPVSPSPHAEIAAVVYDTDAAFDIQRFRHLLLSRISRLPSTTLHPQECVRRALARLHLFRPTSLVQLAASIANLPAYHSAHMPNQEIAVLAIDSISTFYWADRFSAEQLRNIASAKDKGVPMVLSLHHVLDAVQIVRRSHRPLAVLTNWALNSAPSRSESLYKQHLHPFPVIEDGIPDLGAKVSGNTDHSSSSPFRLTHHITLSSPSSDPFPAAPLDDADARRRRDLNDGQITDDDTLIHPSS